MKIYWVATYGDMGLEVEHFTSYAAYARAARKAEREHDNGDLDSYTHGEQPLRLKLSN